MRRPTRVRAGPGAGARLGYKVTAVLSVRADVFNIFDGTAHQIDYF
jgi:hypothetical protein